MLVSVLIFGPIFAVPTSTIAALTSSAAAFEPVPPVAVQPRKLGLKFAPATELNEPGELKRSSALVVREVVAGGLAESAGIRIGDELVAIDGALVRTPAELFELLQRRRLGDTIVVRLRRDGVELRVTASVEVASKIEPPLPTVAEPTEPPHRAKWYGYQIMLCDAGALALAIGAAVTDDPRSDLEPALILSSGLTYLICGPIVHLVHHNNKEAMISGVALRVGAPALGAALVISSFAFDPIDKGGDLGLAVGALVVGVLAGVAALAVDWFMLPYEPIE
jgi:membrane-associated protease RseP (regulator of RpoE activity)